VITLNIIIKESVQHPTSKIAYVYGTGLHTPSCYNFVLISRKRAKPEVLRWIDKDYKLTLMYHMRELHNYYRLLTCCKRCLEPLVQLHTWNESVYA
jgi:hypothetical protein